MFILFVTNIVQTIIDVIHKHINAMISFKTEIVKYVVIFKQNHFIIHLKTNYLMG